MSEDIDAICHCGMAAVRQWIAEHANGSAIVMARTDYDSAVVGLITSKDKATRRVQRDLGSVGIVDL